MKVIALVAIATTAALFAGPAAAQQPDFSNVEIATTDLGNKTYLLEGQGGNITVAASSDGIIVVKATAIPWLSPLCESPDFVRRETAASPFMQR